MNNFPSLPPSDREFILETIKHSEERQARRIGMVLARVDELTVRQDAFEEHVIKGGKSSARSIAISAGTLVSILTGVISYLIDKFQ